MRESDNRVRAAEQRIVAAKIAVDTAELNVDRHQKLAAQGLVSQRELELAIQAAIASKAELQAAEASLKEA
ncbi:MAG: ABC transporter permease, partial [Nitrospiraceae bacterium]